MEYAFHLLFGSAVQLDYKFTTSREAYAQTLGPRLNYSPAAIAAGEVWLPAGPLLWEEGVRPQSVRVFQYKSLPAFFQQPADGAAFPFDLPALAFYLASRYEEYLPFRADAHGRFPAKESLAFREGFLQQPLVNLWALRLADRLGERFPKLAIQRPAFRFLPTYDIDMAWAYKHRPAWLQLAGGLRDLLKGKSALLKERINSLSGSRQDPFDTFRYLEGLHEKYDREGLFFFLLGDYGRYDKNIPASHPSLQQLIRHLSRQFGVGIHPSYRASLRKAQLEKEIQRLQGITGEPVRRSRQHFLRLRFPGTYRWLVQAGIEEDYTMGYADAVGFRAAMATPFRWYSLEAEAIQPLRLHPFAAMDVALRQYMALSPGEAAEKLQQLRAQCQAVGGQFITLWHNSSFAGQHGWKGWGEVYEKIVS